MRRRKIWMKVTDDVYELPVAVADSQKELAAILGIKPCTIASAITRYKKGERPRCLYRIVIIDEDEDDD